jgi:predicted MPP superfamily phosphohydrolase
MSIVLILLIIYGLFHLYVFGIVYRTFPHSAISLLFVAIGLLAMVSMPFLTRYAERHDHPMLAQLLAWPSNLWMALLLWFTTLMLLMDIWNLLIHLVSYWTPVLKGLLIPHRTSFTSALTVSLAALLVGTLEASFVRIKTVELPTPKIPAGTPPVRILFVSDVHLDVDRGRRTLHQILRAAQDLKVDLFLTGGDLVDAPAADLKEYAEALANYHPPLGKFGILGNHEYYARLGESLTFYRQAGIQLLRENVVQVNSNLMLMGVDDPAGEYTHQPSFWHEEVLLTKHNSALFTILLKHQPRISVVAATLCDLQLSGHTHGGQIFPFHGVVRLLYPVRPGLNNIGSLILYVSRGAGTWGPPMRLFAPPDMTLFVLKPQLGHE